MSNLTENRINRILDETAMTNALAAITNLETELPEGSLDDEQRQNFRAINVQNKVFTEDVMIEMENNGATILPPYLNVALLKNDFDLFEQLDNLESRMLNAVRKITDLKRIAGHEAYSFALSVSKATMPPIKQVYQAPKKAMSDWVNGIITSLSLAAKQNILTKKLKRLFLIFKRKKKCQTKAEKSKRQILSRLIQTDEIKSDFFCC